MAKDDNHLSEQYITFTIGEEDYVGLMDIRGKVVNMIDLSKKIMNKKVGESSMNRAIIVKIDGKSLGVIVDKVSHVVHFSSSQIDPPPPSVRGMSSRYIVGVAKKENRFIIIMDIEKILSSEELAEVTK